VKAIVTYTQATTSEVYFENEDLEEMEKAGVDLEDGLAIEAWLRTAKWLPEVLEQNWFEKDAPDIIQIEVQSDDGYLL